jgi:hypothetical protein
LKPEKPHYAGFTLLVKIASTLWFFDREMPFLVKLFGMASLQATKKPKPKATQKLCQKGP